MRRFLILPVLLAFVSVAAQAATRPNVVLIMVDDMGFSDIGCYGSEIPTPNLDRLAADGMRFSQFYNAARCCPTRAAILTGNYNHAVGMPGMEGPGAQYGADGKRIGGKGAGAILRESPSLGEVFRHIRRAARATSSPRARPGRDCSRDAVVAA